MERSKCILLANVGILAIFYVVHKIRYLPLKPSGDTRRNGDRGEDCCNYNRLDHGGCTSELGYVFVTWLIWGLDFLLMVWIQISFLWDRWNAAPWHAPTQINDHRKCHLADHNWYSDTRVSAHKSIMRSAWTSMIRNSPLLTFGILLFVFVFVGRIARHILSWASPRIFRF